MVFNFVTFAALLSSGWAGRGCDTTLISQITGHTYDHTLQILETYMPRNRSMAAKAAAIMEDYYARLSSR